MNLLEPKSSKGFTLIELLAVLVIVGVLAATSLSRLISLSNEARIAVLETLMGSVKATNTLVIAKVLTGTDIQPVSGRADLIDIDIDENGSYETRLKWGHLDNTDIEKWVILSSGFVITYAGIDRTFIGYDIDGDNSPQDDNCYFQYTQANNEGDLPLYSIVTTGC